VRLIVVGAGPVGLVAAHGAAARGFDVTLLEQGEIGDALRRWGAARLFTPLRMNLPAPLVPLLGARAPSLDALLTGPEFAERVLEPLGRALGDRVRLGRRVRAIGRARMTRGELAGHPLRAERPFRVLVDGPGGEELYEAERVLDASGVYGQPCALGSGGLPARGERALDGRVMRDLGALARRSVQLVGRRTLVVGHGHSAANALGGLAELASAYPDTRIIWAVRAANARPIVEVADDPLPERRRVAARANDLAERPPPWLTVERRASVEALAPDGDALRVTLSSGRELVVDELLALTGYRPDHALTSELAIELAPATEGAGRLARAIGQVSDCLSVPRVAPEDLASGEPGFHLVGQKSYGRARTFLLSTGYAQLEAILERL
jgi:hypothetical protein